MWMTDTTATPIFMHKEKSTVKKFYEKASLREWKRLVKDPFHRLEFDTTLYFLKKYLPKKGLILDAGGGPGRYTIYLAKSGYDMVLLDYTPALLEIAKRQISRQGIKSKVKEVTEGSITNLSQFKDNTFDAVICLGGPLSHVEGEENREIAVSELKRVAKKGVPIFLSVMGKFGVVIDASMYYHDEIAMTKHFEDLWMRGEDYMFGGSAGNGTRSYCHFFEPSELDSLVERSGIEIIDRVGLEGFGSHSQKGINLLYKKPQAWKNWMKLHYSMCNHPISYATSGHILLIGKKV
ncbi:MAG: methyltransferase domain-containing protein [Patescibacteria group bacterium]